MNPLLRWLERRRVEPGLSAELAEHLAEKIEQLREEGHSEREATQIARRQFGNLTLLKEDSRAEWGWNLTEQLWQDIRFGWRVLRKAPVFTATVIIVLALGIGMNSAMFSAVKAVLLSALPYPDPERMVQLNQTAEDGHLMNVSHLDFNDWRSQTRTIESIAAYGVENSGVTISGNFPARQVRMANVTDGFFRVAATEPIAGRVFADDEQKPGGPFTLVFGYELAESVFGSPANAIQKSVRLNGLVFTIIGVMPPRFDFPEKTELWLPNDLFPDGSGRSAHNYRVVGRLKRGVTVRRAQSDMDLVAAYLAKQYVDDQHEGIRVTSLYDSLVGGIRPAIWVLFAAVAVVLVIASVNVSSLILVRAAARRKEMAMRGALGAGRRRLIRQLLTESVMLSLAGGTAGLLLAKVVVGVFRSTAPVSIPRIQNLAIDGGVLGFTAGLSLLVGVLFGVLPGLQCSRVDSNDVLKQTTGKGEGRWYKRWGQVLVVGQIMLAVILLSGASLLVKSYWKLAHIDTGISSSGIYVADVSWPASADGNSVDGAYIRRAGSEILRQIGVLRGVEAVAFVHGLPIQGAPDGYFAIEGRPLPADPHLSPDADHCLITPDYFRVFGLPILQGREFDEHDGTSTQQVAIVNQKFVKQFFPEAAVANILGKRIKFLGFDRNPQYMTIVGIVPDMRNEGITREVFPEVYVNYFQHADSVMDAYLVIRGPASLQPQIKRIVSFLDPMSAVNFENMDSLISGTIIRERFQTVLLTVFAACALLLAVVGIYGLLSYTVMRRTSEIGVRMALGASAGSIQTSVLRQGGVLVTAGVTLGLIGSLFATRVLESMVYQVSTTDVSALLAAIAGFSIAAFLGCYLPARRVASIDPWEALRAE